MIPMLLDMTKVTITSEFAFTQDVAPSCDNLDNIKNCSERDACI